MDKAHVEQALKSIKANSSKRNFLQSIDLIVTFKDLDLKKQDNRVDVFAQLHFPRPKPVKICGLVGPELKDESAKNFDTTISVDDFQKHTGKAEIRKLSKNHQFFVAQANVMPQVATAFGRALGPKGKMPNPKAGCVVPPNANLAALKEKLQKTIRIKIETNPMFQAAVGTEETDEAQVTDNILTLYNALIHALPNDKHNIKEAFLKLTMGKPLKIGGEEAEEEEPVKKKKPAKKEESKEEPSEEADAKPSEESEE